ncbi:hypothetical protein B0H10DRAFT_2189715 [Mycena sp. CBHHK59/15]|nr:hypothetical protein B0H10DRAFT_2189715 [Mycena sp. CBHHK59/15]
MRAHICGHFSRVLTLRTLVSVFTTQCHHDASPFPEEEDVLRQSHQYLSSATRPMHVLGQILGYGAIWMCLASMASVAAMPARQPMRGAEKCAYRLCKGLPSFMPKMWPIPKVCKGPPKYCGRSGKSPEHLFPPRTPIPNLSESVDSDVDPITSHQHIILSLRKPGSLYPPPPLAQAGFTLSVYHWILGPPSSACASRVHFVSLPLDFRILKLEGVAWSNGNQASLASG